MTDETLKPKQKRKRRRWIIAGVLLFVVAFASWWNWPRGDARFVGNWSMSYDPDATLTLSPNGLAHHVSLSGDISSYPWQSDGDHLILGNEPEGRLTPMIRAVSLWVYDITSYDFMYGQGEDRYRVASVSGDEVQLENVNDQSKVVMRRIPE